MNPSGRTTTFLLTLFLLAGFAAAAPSGLGPLTFEDEFNGLILDPTKWANRATGPRLEGVNTPDSVSVSGGILTMKVYTETIAGQQTHFTGQIATAGLFEQTYGYFEARVRFNTTPGQWSAFWLQSPTIGADVNDPEGSGVEMDIFEHRVNNSFDPNRYGISSTTDVSNRVNQALIWNGYNNPNQQTRSQLSDPLPGLANNSSEWHTFGLKWAPDGYTFYYDDVAIWSGTPDSPVSERSQYIILSTEVANFFAGNRPPLGFGTKENTTTNLQVDYVRVYAIPEPGGMGGVVVAAMLTLSRRRRRVASALATPG